MTLVKVTAILPKTNPFDVKRFAKAIENAGTESSKAVEVDFNVTTRTWNHKPDFKISHTTGSTSWEIATDDKIYGYINEGTPPHIIKPKNKKALSFFAKGFKPKSRIGWIGSNVGRKANAEKVTVMVVYHPGTDAREFDLDIKEKWDTEWPRQLARAIRAAATYG